LLIAFVVLTAVLAARSPLLGLDLAIAEWCDAHRPAAAGVIGLGFNHLGQGTPLTLLTLAVALWRARTLRSVRPVLVPVVAYSLTYLTIGPLKVLSARPAPHYHKVANPEWLFSVPGEMSYPSGHVVNSLVWYTALSLVLCGVLSPRWQWTMRLVPVLVVVTTTTYLGHHWFTDDVAAVLLGIVLSRVLLRIRWDLVPLGARLRNSGWDRPTGCGGADDQNP
jgi:membrane-associated phospholipid phosphatase